VRSGGRIIPRNNTGIRHRPADAGQSLAVAKLDADAALRHPDDVAGSSLFFAVDGKFERDWQSGCGVDLEAGAAVGYVADQAVDCRTAVVVDDLAAPQGAEALLTPALFHRWPPSSGATMIGRCACGRAKAVRQIERFVSAARRAAVKHGGPDGDTASIELGAGALDHVFPLRRVLGNG